MNSHSLDLKLVLCRGARETVSPVSTARKNVCPSWSLAMAPLMPLCIMYARSGIWGQEVCSAQLHLADSSIQLC